MKLTPLQIILICLLLSVGMFIAAAGVSEILWHFNPTFAPQ